MLEKLFTGLVAGGIGFIAGVILGMLLGDAVDAVPLIIPDNMEVPGPFVSLLAVLFLVGLLAAILFWLKRACFPAWRSPVPVSRFHRIAFEVAVVGAAALVLYGWFWLRDRLTIDRYSADVLAQATRVEGFRIDGRNGPDDHLPTKPGQQRIGGFLITGNGHELDKRFAHRLLDILSDRRTHARSHTMCFWPGVAFRVWGRGQRLDVLICFLCDNIYSGPPTDEAQENINFSSSSMRPRLVRLVKSAFPGDAEIQGLPETK